MRCRLGWHSWGRWHWPPVFELGDYMLGLARLTRVCYRCHRQQTNMVVYADNIAIDKFSDASYNLTRWKAQKEMSGERLG